MTVDQRAREAAAAVRAARAGAEFTSIPPAGRPPRRNRVALAAAGALAVLLLVGIPAALLLGDRGIDTFEVSAPATGAAPPADVPPPTERMREVREPTPAELDTGIRYLRTYSTVAQDGHQVVFAIEQWMSPDGATAGATAAAQPGPADGELAIDPAQAATLLDGAEVLGGGSQPGVAPYGFADRSLPTDPAALEAALTSGPGSGGAMFSPSDALSPDGSALDRRGLILRMVPPLLTPVLDPEVAAAFFDLVTGLEGAAVQEGATDPLGRPAVEVAVRVPMFDDAGAEVGRLAYVTWFDPETKLVTGQRSELVSGFFPGSGYDGPIAGLFVVAARGVVDEMPPLPEPLVEEELPVSPSTTAVDTDVTYVVRDGSAFGSSQLYARDPELLDRARGNLECPVDCRTIDGPRTFHLTIDPILQSELEPYMAGRYADRGAALAVVMDSATGAVRGLAGNEQAVERGLVASAFTRDKAPGTALLPITMAAALERGTSPDTTFVTEGGCGDGLRMTMAEALAAGSESVFCQVTADVGMDRMREVLDGLLGLDGGQRVSIAQMAALYATIGNGGHRPHPHLVDRIVSATGDELGRQLFDDHLVLDPATAAAVAAEIDKFPGYAGVGAGGAGSWQAGTRDGLTTVVWVEDGTVPLADTWSTVMVLAGVELR